MYDHNTGFEIGIIATKLARKVAISSQISWVKASANCKNNKFIYGSVNSKAVNYTVSSGKLTLPKEFKA